MDKKMICAIVLLCFIITASVFLIAIPDKKPSQSQNKEFLGPVQPGMNETYFRETGKTIPLNPSG